ncbi:MAG: AzlC family ABC transporter permease [Clostridia bacterium]|nr:AzlC family ABC transporter permease [Clostridia bacterium]
MKQKFFQGVRHGIPIALGYLSVSFTFGMKAVADGLTPLQAVLISMTNVTSAGQFAGLPLMLAQASLIEVALTQLIINLRYALMSISLSQKLDSTMTTLHRMCFSFCNTDEIFAVASGQQGKVGKWYLYGLMSTPWFGWALGTLLGAVAGTLLPPFVRSALGIAIYGMFLAIILPPARKEKSVRAVVLLAVGLSLCFRYLPMLKGISSGFVIIICAVVASAVGAWLFPVKEAE